MKRIFLLTVAIIFTANFINAQDVETDLRENFMFGLKVGANYSNVYDTKGEEFVAENKFGIATGAFISIPLGKYFGIQPEILLSQKGFKATGVFLGNPYEINRRTTYLDIPLYFAFKPSEFITLLAGPEFSYLLKQKDSFSNSVFTSEQEQEFNNDDIRRNTLSFILGGDVNIKAIVLSARAGWDIQNNNGDGTSETPRYKNLWYQLTIGFRI